MPTTRSRALKSNNTSVTEPTVAAQPAIPPPPDRQKRKRSRVETENIASTVPDGENDAMISAATATGVSAKKRKMNVKKAQGKPMATKPSMPLPPQAVAVKVVNPTPPDVSQKAMRSAGSVIAKFDPWKMRDSTPHDSNGYELDISGASVDNAAACYKNTSTQSTLQADEHTAATEVLVNDNPSTRHRIGSTEATADTGAEATIGQSDERLQELEIRVPGGVPKGLRAGDELGSAENDKGKPDFSTSDSEGTTRSPISKNGTNSQQKATAPTNVQGGEDNPRLSLEETILQQERDTEVEVDPTHCAALLSVQNEGTPEIGPSPDAGPSATFQQQSLFPSFVNSKLDGDSDAGSSVYSEDGEGIVDEEYWDSVQIENSLRSARYHWKNYHSGEKAEDRVNLLEESGSNTVPQQGGVEEEVENPDRYEGLFETPAADHQKVPANYTPDGSIETSTPRKEDVPPNHDKPDGTYDDKAAPLDGDEEIAQGSSGIDSDENNMPFSIEADYLSDSSRCGYSGLGEQGYDERGPSENDPHVEEAERSEQGSEDDLSDFLNDDNGEQSTPERDEDDLEDHGTFKSRVREGGHLLIDVEGPQGMQRIDFDDECQEKAAISDADYYDNATNELSEPETGGTPQNSGKTEGMDEDRPSSPLGSSHTPEREEMDDRAICGGSDAIVFPTDKGGFEDHVGVGHRHTAETADGCANTSKRGSQGDRELADGYAESDEQRISQSAPEFDRALEVAPWRQPNAFENVQPSGPILADRGSSLHAEVATSPGLPPGVQGMFDAVQSYRGADVRETHALLKGIHETLTLHLEIKQRESQENEKFRQFVISRLDRT